jgi:HEAT repeat protein
MFRTIIAACVVAGSLHIGQGQEPQAPQPAHAVDVPTRQAVRAIMFFAVEDSDRNVRLGAFNALAVIGQVDEGLDKALRRGLKDPFEDVRQAAVRALVSIDLDPKVAVPVLIEAACDPNPKVSQPAVARLAQLGEGVVPYLLEALKDKKTQAAALAALSAIGPVGKPAVPALTEILKDPDPAVRLAAVHALATILAKPGSFPQGGGFF